MKPNLWRAGALLCCWLLAGAVSQAGGKEHEKGGLPALADTTILLIRHADKPDEGTGLAPAGVTRANAYVGYFQNYRVDGNPLKLTALFAAANSAGSQRPYLTLAPLSQATGLPIDSQFKDKEYAKLAEALQATDHGQGILVCWHHGAMPGLLAALGADPQSLLPGGEWPAEQYGWVIQLRYGKHGELKESKRVEENL